jgi:hypothetical protein
MSISTKLLYLNDRSACYNIHRNNIYERMIVCIHARTSKNKNKTVIYYTWTPIKKMSFSIIIDIM